MEIDRIHVRIKLEHILKLSSTQPAHCGCLWSPIWAVTIRGLAQHNEFFHCPLGVIKTMGLSPLPQMGAGWDRVLRDIQTAFQICTEESFLDLISLLEFLQLEMFFYQKHWLGCFWDQHPPIMPWSKKVRGKNIYKKRKEISASCWHRAFWRGNLSNTSGWT